MTNPGHGSALHSDRPGVENYLAKYIRTVVTHLRMSLCIRFGEGLPFSSAVGSSGEEIPTLAEKQITVT